MFHQVTVLGRLTRDPERKVDSGPVELNVAIDDGYTDKNTGDWIDRVIWVRVAVWHKRADWADKHLRKGDAVHIVGTLVHKNGNPSAWIHTDSGEARAAFEIRADKVTVVWGGRRADEDVADDMADPAVDHTDDIPF